MKTAISIPDSVFREADSFAKRHHLSRSALYAQAVKAYVDQHRRADVTERLNAVYPGESSSLDDLLQKLQSASLPPEDWQ